MFLAFLLCQGSYCSENRDPPSLPTAILTDIHLEIKDPALGTPGIYVAWSYPEGSDASYFEIYQSHRVDSLKHVLISQSAEDSNHVVLALSDSSRPFTLYFAVRAVLVEPTGQKLVGDTLSIDSLTLTPSVSILRPVAGSFRPGRGLDMEVQTRSDPGVTIRFFYYEKWANDWSLKQSGCLPLDPCPSTIFGNSVQRAELTLDPYGENDTIPALFCVVGTESFEERSTGLMQSLGCKRFFRAGR
ncbi:MAG: hypothetical protein ABIW76_04195 [Fibrobacteria bacterium]